MDRKTDKEDVVYTYLYNKIKEEWNNTICSNMDRPRDYHTKRSKPDRETQISYEMSLICRIWTNDTNEFMYKTKINSQA